MKTGEGVVGEWTDGGASTLRGPSGRRVDMNTIGRLVSTEPSCVDGPADRPNDPSTFGRPMDQSAGPGVRARFWLSTSGLCGAAVTEGRCEEKLGRWKAYGETE
jgi:hypothetical protein